MPHLTVKAQKIAAGATFLPGTDKEAAPPFLVRRAVPLNKHDIMKNKIALPSIILASLLATGFLRAGDAKPAAPVVIPPEDAAAGGWADSGPLGFYFANPDFRTAMDSNTTRSPNFP